MSKSCSGKINKTRYDDLGKLMKQTSFTIKNLRGSLPKKQSTIVKRSFICSTKPLSLDSTIPINELTAETFYHFRTSELFNNEYHPFCTDPSMLLTHQLEKDCWLQSSSLHQQWRSRSTWLQNPKAQKRSSFGHLLHMFSLYYLMWRPLK